MESFIVWAGFKPFHILIKLFKVNNFFKKIKPINNLLLIVRVFAIRTSPGRFLNAFRLVQ